MCKRESPYRLQPEDIGHLRTRNLAGEMIPLGSWSTLRLFSGRTASCTTTDFQPRKLMARLLRDSARANRKVRSAKVAITIQLPNGMKYEWTELDLPENSCRTQWFTFFRYLFSSCTWCSAAQYESWSLPLVHHPDCSDDSVSAIAGVWLLNGDNNVFTQIS